MKRIATILAIAIIIPLASFTQDNEMAKLFRQYKNVQGFEMTEFDPDLDINGEDEFDITSFLDEVEKIYILSFNSENGNTADLNDFTTKLDKLLEKKNFETMIDVDSESKVRVLMRKDKNDKLSDFLISSVDNDEASFIWAMAP